VATVSVPPSPVSVRRGRARNWLRRPPAAVAKRLAAFALFGLVANGLALAFAALADPSRSAPSALGAGWLGDPLHGLSISFPAVFPLLLGGMLVCYCALLPVAKSIPPRWAVAAIVGLNVAFLLTPPILSNDVLGYAVYERMLVHGIDPYLHGSHLLPATDALHRYTKWWYLRSDYGPLWTIGTYPLGLTKLVPTLWAFKAIVAAASLGCAALTWKIARRLGRAPVPAALLVALNPLVLASDVGGAHNDPLVMLLVLAGVYLALGSRGRWGGGSLIAAFGMKASAGLALPFALVGAPGRARVAQGAALAFVLLAGVAFAVFGHGMVGYVHELHHVSGFVSKRSVPTELTAPLGHLHGTQLVVVKIVGAATFLLGSALLLYRTARGADWIGAAGWATLLLMVTSTWLTPWWILWVLPFAALARSPRLRVAAAAFTVFLVLGQLP
jgi:hypothetical protein